MARKIDNLLSKKGWTGAEVGKALISSIVHDIKHQGEPNSKPLFSQSDFDKMENSLNTERDFLTYGVYRDIYSGIIDTYNRGQALYQQFYNGYYRYGMYLSDAKAADNILRSAEHIPYVMSEEQYHKFDKIAENKLKSFKESFNSLIFYVLIQFMTNPNDAPETIKNAIEATKKEPLTNKRILANYCETYGMGYYQLPDGTRSDNVDEKEWLKILMTNFCEKHKLRVNGERATFNNTVWHYSFQRKIKACKLLFDGAEAIKELYQERTGEELTHEGEVGIMKALECLLNDRGEEEEIVRELEMRRSPLQPALNSVCDLLDGELSIGAEWHYYADPPAGITKYDILEDIRELYDTENDAEEFKADYPALYKAIEAYIKETVPQAKDLKPNQYGKDFISWGELADQNVEWFVMLSTSVEDIEEIMAQEDEDTLENFLKRRRLLVNGITISKEPRFFQLNENGDFIDKAQDAFLNLAPEKSIDSIAQNDIQREDLTAFQDKLFKPALSYIYAFNALIRILGDVYDLEEIEEIQLKTAEFEAKLYALNNIIYLFYATVYGTPKEKDRKRELIKEVFCPVNYEELKPSEEAIAALTAELNALGFSTKARKKLKKFDDLIDKLCERGV